MIGGAETGLDRVLWPGALAQPRDGMSPAATICALLATAASFIISLQRPGDRMPAHASRLVEVLGVCGLLMAGTAVVTYMLDAPALRHVDMFVAMSAQSALALVLLFVAILAAPSDGVIAGVLLGSLRGSSGARRLLPVMVFAPLAIAFAGIFATHREWIDARLGLSLMTMLMIAIGAAAVLVNAALQNRAERVQMQTLQTVTEAAEEKDLLLREVYHRVKNNLQRIDAMLAFESAQVADRGTRDAFEAMSHRIRALGIVHELLLRSERLANIDVADYMQRLTEELTRSNGLDRRGIAIVCDARPEIVDFETANTLGLLVNELVVNAIEHAFPFDTSGTIRVVFHRASQDTCRLTVADDGVNNSVYDPTNPACGGIGSRIIRSLARQLGGDLRVDTSLGTRVDVSFPCAAVEWSYSV